MEYGSGNVFADLGFEDADAMLSKAAMVFAITTAMEGTNTKATELAARTAIQEQQLERLLDGLTDSFTTDQLLRILNCLGQDVEIVVRPKPATEDRPGQVSVAIKSA